MKEFFNSMLKFAAFALIASFAFSSCSKSDDDKSDGDINDLKESLGWAIGNSEYYISGFPKDSVTAYGNDTVNGYFYSYEQFPIQFNYDRSAFVFIGKTLAAVDPNKFEDYVADEQSAMEVNYQSEKGQNCTNVTNTLEDITINGVAAKKLAFHYTTPSSLAESTVYYYLINPNNSKLYRLILQAYDDSEYWNRMESIVKTFKFGDYSSTSGNSNSVVTF